MFIPKDAREDITISIQVGHVDGLRICQRLRLERIMVNSIPKIPMPQ